MVDSVADGSKLKYRNPLAQGTIIGSHA